MKDKKIKPHKTRLHGIFFTPPIFDMYLGHQMSETFKELVYAQFVVGKKDLTILDIGANVGVTAYYFSHFAKMIYAMEPSKQHFEALSTMVKYNKLKNITPINKALYLRSGKLPLFNLGNRTAFTLINMGLGSPSELVDCITIKDLFDEYKLDNVDLLKLDIEGNEYDILCSTDFKDVCKKIKAIVFETHTWSGRNPNQIKDALTKNGYELGQINVKDDVKLFVAKRHDI